MFYHYVFWLNKLSRGQICVANLIPPWEWCKYFFMLWYQVALIFLVTSQLTVLNNYLCALDTTIRIL